MHLPIEMVRQSPIIIQTRQVSSADIADLQFLMSRGTGCIRKGLEFAFLFLFGSFGGANFVVFQDGECDRGRFAKNCNFEKAGVDGVG